MEVLGEKPVATSQAVCRYLENKTVPFTGLCIVIYFYSKTNQMHQSLKFIGVTLYTFRTIFQSNIRS